jgi:membrane-bound metal-dependent hydrolase YbcI (DUF457 family)
MPSPIGHALGGALVAVVLAPSASSGSASWSCRGQASVTLLRLAAVAGCAPDVDFFWGRHNMETHSLGAALAVGVVAWALSGKSIRVGVVAALAVATHVLFDWLGSDDTPPLGVMALWPLTSRFYFADAFVFEAISRRYWLDGFLAHNLYAVLMEVALLAPVIGVMWWLRRPPTSLDA